MNIDEYMHLSVRRQTVLNHLDPWFLKLKDPVIYSQPLNLNSAGSRGPALWTEGSRSAGPTPCLPWLHYAGAAFGFWKHSEFGLAKGRPFRGHRSSVDEQPHRYVVNCVLRHADDIMIHGINLRNLCTPNWWHKFFIGTPISCSAPGSSL